MKRAGPFIDQRVLRVRVRCGFTLVELMMVMGLIGLMLGFGIGAISSIDLGSHAAGSTIRSTLRGASNWSRARQAPAQVRIDLERGRVRAEGLAVVGTWHFEKAPPVGAFGLDGQIFDAELIDDGFVGKALGFTRAPAGASYEVPVHTDPAFSLNSGFQLRVELRPEGARGGKIIQLGDSLQIEATTRLGLRVSIQTQRFDPETGKPKPAGKAVLETPAAVLNPDAWNSLLVTYDRSRLRIFVQELEVAQLKEEGDVVPVQSKMVLGGGQRTWSGSMDSLVISAVGVEEDVVLPEGVMFAPDTPKTIVFDAGGGLDRSLHDGPVVIELLFDDGRREVIRVNLYGTIE